MATHNPEKLRKGLMNFYKSKSKSKSKSNSNQNVNEVVNKTISASRSFMIRKPSNYQEEPQRGGVVEEAAPVAVVERRKSVSQVETTNVEGVASFLQVKVMVSDMPPFMQLHAFKCARTTFDSSLNFSSKHMAFNLKKEFDRVYGPAWHCIVGSSFGSYVTHSTGCFLYFSIDKLYILLFKTKIQKIPT